MTNKNDFSEAGYIIINALLYTFLCYQYLESVLYLVPELKEWISRLLMWLGGYALMALGVLATIRKRRSIVNLFANSLLPIELYTLYAYCRCLDDKLYMLIIMLAATLTIILIYFIAVLLRKKAGYGEKVSLKERLLHGLLGSRVLASVCLISLLIPPIYRYAAYLYVNF